MFGQFAEQVKQSSKPESTLVAVNAKALEAISQHQTAFFTGLLSDSVHFMQAATKQTQLNGFLAAQSAYSESVRDRLTTVSSGTLSTLTGVREDLSKVMKETLIKPDPEAVKPTAAKKAVAKKQVVTKPEPKTAAAKTSPEAKVESQLTEVTKAPVKKAAPKTAAKPAQKATTNRKTTRKPATKSATPKSSN
jgi:hypothetical protein